MIYLMDGRRMKNTTALLKPLHQTCIQDCTLFSSDLKTLGRERHHLFKCHNAYICLLKYSNLFQDSKCLTGVNYGCWLEKLSYQPWHQMFSPWPICLSLRVIIQEQEAFNSKNIDFNDLRRNMTHSRKKSPEIILFILKDCGNRKVGKIIASYQ